MIVNENFAVEAISPQSTRKTQRISHNSSALSAFSAVKTLVAV